MSHNAAPTTSGNSISNSNKAVDASGLNTVSGSAISSTNKIVDASIGAQERPNGMILNPWGSATNTYSASTARGVRFVPQRTMTIKSIGFVVIGTLATNNESVYVAIYDANNGTTTGFASGQGTPVDVKGSLTTTPGGSTSTTINGSAGAKFAPLNGSTGVTVTAGNVYYAVLCITFTSGTGVGVITYWPGSGYSALASDTATLGAWGKAELVSATASSLASNTFSGGTASYATTSNAPVLSLLTI